MGNSTYSNTLDPFHRARGAAVNTFTTFRDVSPTELATTYANELRIGTKIEVEAWGEFSTTATPTLQFGIIYNATAGAAGGTTLAASGTITTGSGAAAWPWHLNWHGLVTAVGASGVIYGQGILDLGTSLIAFAPSSMPITAAARSVTIDTTIKALWGVGAAFNASSASNQVRVDVLNVKFLNQGATS